MESMGDTPFSRIYRHVVSHPSVSGRAVELTSEFKRLTGDSARFRYITALTPLRSYDHPVSTTTKCQMKSNDCRAKGNDHYSRKDFRQALELYNECIRFAEPGSSLALGYANRSALLYDCGRIKEALKDVERSFGEGYPSSLIFKLHLRKAKILRDLDCMHEARNEIDKGRKLLPEDSSRKSWALKFDEVSAVVNGGKPTNIYSCPEEGADSMDIESVKGSRHPVFMSASSQIDMLFSQDFGRFFVAKHDLEPGDVIMVEKPYASCLLPEAHSDHCQNCYRWCELPVPCGKCANAVFCSEKCRSAAAWFHETECAAMEAVYDDEYGPSAYLAFRTILTKTFAQWKDFAASDLGGAAGENDAFSSHVNDVYDPADYANVFTLIKNSAARNPSDLFKRSIMAFCLVDTLKKTYLKKEIFDEDFELWLGGVVLRHLQNYPCNAHSVDEMVIRDPKDMTKTSDCGIAAAAYPTLSLLNHSCDPNTVRVEVGDVAIVRVIRPIRAGEEIFCNYGAHYAMMPKKDRQATLKKQYFFECQCVPCKKDWPLFASLCQVKENYKCPNCKASDLWSVVKVCPKCSVDLKLMWETLDVMQRNYAKMYDEILMGSSSDDHMKFLIEYLVFLEDIVVRPSAAYNDCQETLKQCMLMRGNKRVVPQN